MLLGRWQEGHVVLEDLHVVSNHGFLTVGDHTTHYTTAACCLLYQRKMVKKVFWKEQIDSTHCHTSSVELTFVKAHLSDIL